MAKKLVIEPKMAPRPPRPERPDRPPRPPRKPRVGRVVLTITALALAFTGCARFSTNQVENRLGDDGKLTGTIRTKVAAWTFFDSKSNLGQFEAMQTAATQRARVGSLAQEANGTNAVAMLNALANIAAALPK